MTVRIDSSLAGIDWEQAKADLVADRFDNGRTAEALRRSFEQSTRTAEPGTPSVRGVYSAWIAS
jgi:hypothetical protein